MASITHWRRQLNTQLLRDPVVADAFASEAVEKHCRDAEQRWRHSFWSPTTTILTFLLQVLDPAKTLRMAATTLLTHLAAEGEKHLPSADPTAYCQARKRLPGEALPRIMLMLADRMQGLVTRQTGWLSRRVWVVDGSSASMPDELELQKKFPQPSQQAPVWDSAAPREGKWASGVISAPRASPDIQPFRLGWSISGDGRRGDHEGTGDWAVPG